MWRLVLALLMLASPVRATAAPGACAPESIPGPGGECLPGSTGPGFGGDPRVRAGEIDGMRFNVLLPVGYESSVRSYPTLYLLHPFNGNHDAWLLNSDLLHYTAQQDVIVVLPDAGNSSGLFIDGRDGSCRSETQLLQSVIPHVDAHYRTRPQRSQRAIAGASGGATSAMHLAAAHPDRFVAVGSLSGPPDLMAVQPLLAQAYLLQAERAAVRDCGGNPLTGGLFGTPLRDELWVRNANPADLAINLRGLSLFIAAGNGQPCDADDLAELHRMPTTVITGSSARSFTQALDREGIPYTADLDRCGFHSWRYFERDLHTFWPQMLAAFGSAAPAAFDHRRADAVFEAWDWRFSADPRRAPEFLEARDMSPAGLTLTGSGITAVTTAAAYPTGARVLLHDGETTRSLVADGDGRLHFTVDLGPPHATQQYSAENALAEAAPDYFKTRRLRLEPQRPEHRGGGSFDAALCLLLIVLLRWPVLRWRIVATLLMAAAMSACTDASTAGADACPIRFEPPREFVATTAGAGSGPAAIVGDDFDGDGHTDLAIADPFGFGINLFLGRGDGEFAPAQRIPTQVDSYALAAGDIDGNGVSDLVAAATLGSTITVLLGQGDGRFAEASRFVVAGGWPQQIAIADFDDDGRADLAVLTHSPGTVSLFAGDGRGGFTPAGQFAIAQISLSLASADFNGDRIADLAVTDAEHGRVHVLLGRGRFGFVAAGDYAVGQTPEHVVAVDIDGDGAIDLLAANEGSGDVAVLAGRGDGRFQAARRRAAGGAATGLGVADFNGDGRLDLAVGNYRDHRVSILAATAPGVFALAASYAVAGAPQALVTADFSGDGLPDLVAPGTVPLVSGGLSNRASLLVNASVP